MKQTPRTTRLITRLVRSQTAQALWERASTSPRLRSALVDVLRDPEILAALMPHVNAIAFDRDLRGMDLHGAASRPDKGTQVLLMLRYQELLRTGQPLPTFEDIGFRCFSQFDEDGVLLYILSLIGMTTRTSVEICAGVGYECNTANLIVNHNFYGLLVDGNANNTETARLFFGTRPDTSITPPVVAHSWIESDTVDDLVRGNGFTGVVDVLSIDLDGIDYWVWKALTCIDPRVVVVEYHSSFGPDEAVTVPDTKGFRYSDDKGAFCGASLAAFNKLAIDKGYRLVGCNRNRLNAFFVKQGVGDEVLPEVSVASCLDHHRLRLIWDQVRSVALNWDWETV